MDNLNRDIELYRQLLSMTSEAVFVFSHKGDIVYANEAAHHETGYEDLTNVDITDIFPMALRKVKGGITWQSEAAFMQTFAYRSNQTCYSVRLICKNVGDHNSGYYVAYAVNDSERYEAVSNHKKAMEEVEEANKMKNEFTANITHELRTPINGIKGMAEGLADTELSSEQSETVNIILHCCDNMIKIINDILDFAKIEAGRIELEEREFSFGKFLNDTLTFHLGKMNEKGLKLVVNVSGDIPDRLVGDELRLGQVLNNLFSNAIKFTSSGQIGLEVTGSRAAHDMTELFFMVIDTGIGISAQEKDKLFRSFSQVDGSITRRFGGTGLGLAITKQLVTLMGGSISVESEKGKGSTFSFTVRMKNSKEDTTPIQFPKGNFTFTKNLPVASRIERSDVMTVAPGGPVLTTGSYHSDTGSGLGFIGTGALSEVSEYDFGQQEDDTLLSDTLEKLMISVELGSWEKAESFASLIKNRLSSDPELKKIAFALLLNVRKEKYDLCVQEIEELEKRLEAEK